MFSNSLRRVKILIYSLFLYGLASKDFYEKDFKKIHNLLYSSWQLRGAASVSDLVLCCHLKQLNPYGQPEQFVDREERMREVCALSSLAGNTEKYGLWFTALTLLTDQD